MESEKVKEIKKALENCQKNNCLDCPYFIDEKRCRANDLLLDTINLINELEKCSEKWQKLCADEVVLNTPLKERINELESKNKELNNELKRYKLDWLNSEKMHLQADMEDTEFELFCANKSLDEVRAENKQLKDRIAELEKENGELLKENEGYHGSYRCAIDKIGELSAERYIKVEQFAERLKEKLFDLGNIVNENDIDETLKEFINEE